MKITIEPGDKILVKALPSTGYSEVDNRWVEVIEKTIIMTEGLQHRYLVRNNDGQITTIKDSDIDILETIKNAEVEKFMWFYEIN